MNLYRIELKRYNTTEIIAAETAGKAKYSLFRRLDEYFDDFEEFVHCVRSCIKIPNFQKEDLPETKEEIFKDIAHRRGVPLVKPGTKVKFWDEQSHNSYGEGVIVGANSSCNFDVFFKNIGIVNCHPHDFIFYDDYDNILYDFTP